MKLNNFASKLTRQVAGEPGGGAPAPAADPAAAAPAAQPAGPDLSFIPETFHVDGKPDLAKFAEHFQGMTKAEQERAAAIPADGKYAFDLPADLKFDGIEGLPEGFKIDNNMADPMFAPIVEELSATLKEIGAPAAAAGKVASLLAKYEAIQYAAAAKALKADMATLGTEDQVKSRVETLHRNLQTVLPKEEAAGLLQATTSASAVKALEKLLSGRSMTSPNPTPAAPEATSLDLRYPKTAK